jgi:antitoxin component YwqK of YwqJK toxin-antitoxin module
VNELALKNSNNNDDIKKAASQVDDAARDPYAKGETIPAKNKLASKGLDAREEGNLGKGRAPYAPPSTAGTHASTGLAIPDETDLLDSTDENLLSDTNENIRKKEKENALKKDEPLKKDSHAEKDCRSEKEQEPPKGTPPRNGIYEYTDKNSKRHVITYTDGDVTGPVHIFDISNKLEIEGQMRKGKLCGICRTYKDGVIQSESEMENDVPHGLTKQFDEAGILWLETTFVEGKKHGQMRQYNKNGSITSTTMYEADNMHGPSESFNDGGDVESRTYYVAGKMHGTMEAFYSRVEGGGCKRLSHYDTGELHGTETIYQSSGVILAETTYEHGTKVQAAPSKASTKSRFSLK